MNSVGSRILALYLLGYYFAPLLLGAVFDYEYLDFLSGEPSFLFVSVFLVSFTILLFGTKGLMAKVSPPFEHLRFPFFDWKWLSFYLALVFIGFSSYFFLMYGFSFRHKGDSISKVSGIVPVVIFLQIYFSAYMLHLMGKLSYRKQFAMLEKITMFLVFVSLGLSLTSSLDFVAFLVSALLLLAMTTKFNLLLNNGTLRGPQMVLKGGLVLAGFFLAFFVGIANKWGVERAIQAISDFSFENLFVLPLRRLSFHLYSASYHLNYSILDIDLQTNGIIEIINSFLFRFSYLLGLDPDKPLVAGVNRMNSLSIYDVAGAKNGVSPGMLGAPFFFPYFPLNLIFWSIFVVFVSSRFSDLFNKSSKLSLLGLVFILVSFQGVVDSSVDVLNPIGKNGLSFLMLLLVWLSRPRVAEACH